MMLSVKSKQELHPEEIAQLREFVKDQYEQGYSNINDIIETLKFNGSRYHIGVIASTLSNLQGL